MTRPLFCFCAAFALGCIASQYFLAPALWLPAAGIVLVLGALGLLLRGPMRRRVLLCALGMAFAFGWNAAYARFIAAPNEALIGAAEDVELELCSYAVETNYGAKATVRILGRGLRGRAVYYGGFDLLALEPGEHVRDTVLPIPRATVATSAILRPRASTCCFTTAASRRMRRETLVRCAMRRSASRRSSARPSRPSTASGRAAFCAPCSSATSAILTWRIRRT